MWCWFYICKPTYHLLFTSKPAKTHSLFKLSKILAHLFKSLSFTLKVTTSNSITTKNVKKKVHLFLCFCQLLYPKPLLNFVLQLTWFSVIKTEFLPKALTLDAAVNWWLLNDKHEALVKISHHTWCLWWYRVWLLSVNKNESIKNQKFSIQWIDIIYVNQYDSRVRILPLNKVRTCNFDIKEQDTLFSINCHGNFVYILEWMHILIVFVFIFIFSALKSQLIA